MLRSLLLSRDDGTIRVVRRCFRDLEVELENYPETKIAIQKAAELRFDAIVIDDVIEDARVLLERVVEFPTCNKSVRIVLADASAKADSIFKAGIQVVLYKPLSVDRVRHGLRAVRNLMARERRRGSKRITTAIPARLSPQYSKGTSKQILIVDLSESGAAISVDGDLPATASFNLDFAFPGSSDRTHATAEVAWRNSEGAAGLHFVDMSSYARKQLATWIKQNSKEKPQAALATRAGS